jgi:hypothetical protein
MSLMTFAVAEAGRPPGQPLHHGQVVLDGLPLVQVQRAGELLGGPRRQVRLGDRDANGPPAAAWPLKGMT